jgi:hypothetical protein
VRNCISSATEAARAQGLKKRELNKIEKINYKNNREAFVSRFFVIFYCRKRKNNRLLLFISMKKIIPILILLSVLLFSCARGITPYQAANGKAKCGRYLK